MAAKTKKPEGVVTPSLADKVIKALNMGEWHLYDMDVLVIKAKVLLDAFLRISEYHNEEAPIDVIDFNHEIRDECQGKDFIHIVGDNFGQYVTFKKYELILINALEDDGFIYFLKAVFCLQHGGKLACLLRADVAPTTMQNSAFKGLSGCSVKRTDLGEFVLLIVTRDTEHVLPSAIIQCNSCFSKEVNLNIIQRYQRDVMIGDLFLSEYKSLRNYFVVSVFKEEETDEDCPVIVPEPISLNKYVELTRLKYWTALFNLEETDGWMPHYYRKHIYRFYREVCQKYEFDRFNIDQLKRRLAQLITTSIEKGILNAFDTFLEIRYNGASSKYVEPFTIYGSKTDKGYKLPNKLVYSVYYNDVSGSVFKHIREELESYDVLFRCLYATPSSLYKEVDTRDISLEDFHNVEFNYFVASIYKKGSIHITFKEDYYKDAINLFVAKKRQWVFDGYGVECYEYLDKQKRKFVDAFQGKEVYQKIVNGPDKYYRLISKLPCFQPDSLLRYDVS
jgi:hypothetical protein